MQASPSKHNFCLTHSVLPALFNVKDRREGLSKSLVEVFRTNVTQRSDADNLRNSLFQLFPHYDIHFDLEDCDKILRIENPDGSVEVSFILEMIRAKGYAIEILED